MKALKDLTLEEIEREITNRLILIEELDRELHEYNSLLYDKIEKLNLG